MSLDDAFAFFADPRNLAEITPRWLEFEIVDAPERLEEGSLIAYRLRLFHIPIRWRTRIVQWQPPYGFVDVQIAGPYRRWEHTHRLRAVEGGTEIHDRVLYRLPLEPLSTLVAPLTVERWLDDIFAFRAERIAALEERLRPTRG